MKGRFLSRWSLRATVVCAAIAVTLVTQVPPASLAVTPLSDGTLAGSLHVHTDRSDGRFPPEQIAAAAARAGLQFIVLTDHGDGTRVPDPPVYRSGVLCIDAVEVSTSGGHYIALGMSPAPYPLGGEPRDVVEDVNRLGGFGVAAHPDSPRPELEWRDWTAPIDAVEWLNLDTSWRVHLADGWRQRLGLAAALFKYPIRPTETLASLIDHPDATIARWNVAAKERRVVVTAGSDAHGAIALRGLTSQDAAQYRLPFPGYESSFRALSVRVTPDRPLSGNAGMDAAIVERAIRAGHLYIATDGVASPPSLQFTATNERGTAAQGDEIPIGGQIALRVRTNAPDGFSTVVYKDEAVWTTDHRRDFTVSGGNGPGVFRLEVRSDRPWLYSNPIYVGERTPPRRLDSVPATGSMPLFEAETTGWRLESDDASTRAVDIAPVGDRHDLRFTFGLAGGQAANQMVALVRLIPKHLDGYDRLTFTARADQPMRMSVQLRVSDERHPLHRWQRSVYIDTTERESTLFLNQFTAVVGSEPHPPLDRVDSVMFVVDTTNTRPGSSGRIWLRAAALGR